MRISWSVGGDVTPESEPADPSIRSNHEPHMTYTPTLQHALSRAQVPVVRLQLNKGEKKQKKREIILTRRKWMDISHQFQYRSFHTASKGYQVL